MSNVRAGIGVGVLLGLTLSVLLLLMTTAPAQAQTVEDECQAEITELSAATAAAQTFTNDKDQAGLVGKLESASAKLVQGKTADALKNLASFRDKVITLDAQDKLGEDEAAALRVGADEAIACLTTA